MTSVLSREILGTRVDATSYGGAAERIIAWARSRDSRYICVANVSSVMESYDSPALRSAMNAADLVTPDGVPLVWALRLLGVADAARVYGPDLTGVVLESAARQGVPVGFY